MSPARRMIEIELKLQLSGSNIRDGILDSLRSLGYAVGPIHVVKHTDLYIDSYDWDLFKTQLSLRFRKTNANVLMTIKGVESSENGVTRRIEIEETVDASVLKTLVIPSGEIHDLVSRTVDAGSWIPHVTIRTERQECEVRCHDNTRLMLAFDMSCCKSVWVESDNWSSPRYEFEAELVEGNPQNLQQLSGILIPQFSLIPSHGSKLESAIAQMAIPGPSKRTLPHLNVQAGDRFDNAARKTIQVNLDRLIHNRVGILKNLDIECVHQARVATRRMRSALRLFRDGLHRGMTEYFRRELGWIARELGRVRDLDVVMIKIAKWFESVPDISPHNIRAVLRWAASDRMKHLRTVKKHLTSVRFSILEKRLRAFLSYPFEKAPRSGVAASPIHSIAPILIMKRYKKVLALKRAIDQNPQPERYHALRIQIKQLRYTCEFFSFAIGSEIEAFAKTLTTLQDALGEMQDTVFAREMLMEICKSPSNRSHADRIAFDLGRLFQYQFHFADNQRQLFDESWEEVFSKSARHSVTSFLESLMDRDHNQEPETENMHQ